MTENKNVFIESFRKEVKALMEDSAFDRQSVGNTAKANGPDESFQSMYANVAAEIMALDNFFNDWFLDHPETAQVENSQIVRMAKRIKQAANALGTYNFNAYENQ